MFRLMMFLVMAQFAVISGTYANDGQKSLSSTISVYVFPTEGQDSSRQSQDEAACYQWAAENTGYDPFELANENSKAQQQAAAQKQAASQAGKGAGLRGAFGGALGGALIGEIVDDDPGKGAEYGAVLGARSSRKRARNAQNQAVKSAEAQQQSTAVATATQLEDFKKAFSVCLEAKSYMVKF